MQTYEIFPVPASAPQLKNNNIKPARTELYYFNRLESYSYIPLLEIHVRSNIAISMQGLLLRVNHTS